MKLNDTQFALVKERMKTAKNFEGSLYSKKFKDIDIEAISTQEDFESLPFTEKSELREGYPL